MADGIGGEAGELRICRREDVVRSEQSPSVVGVRDVARDRHDIDIRMNRAHKSAKDVDLEMPTAGILRRGADDP